jgi:hypothetical protein
MQAMFFIHTGDGAEEKTYARERQLLVKMWRLLRRDEAVSRHNLKVFLLGVMNYYLPALVGDEDATVAEVDQPTDAPSVDASFASEVVGHFVNDRLTYTEADAGKIHKAFQLFYENRSYVTKPSNQNPRLRSEVEEPSFHP